jgi:hypothetical protein
MSKKEVLLATAEMGYGHLRALYPFREIAGYRFVILGQTDRSKKIEKVLWKAILKMYETVSRLRKFPLIGWLLFGIMNKLLSIPSRKEKQKNVDKSFSFWLLERFIGIGLCKGIQNELHEGRNILMTSFYVPVIALSKRKDVKIYCQICDSDLSSVWVIRNSEVNRTHYFAPCQKAINRLLSYGVQHDMIHLTGFPLPDYLVGGFNQEIAKRNFQKRMILLENPKIISSDFPLKIAYVIGGAGAYSEVGIKVALSLIDEIIDGEVVLYLVTGIKHKVTLEYQKFKEKQFPGCANLQIVEASNHFEYFQRFNEVVSTIHLLWTKPSELVFYSALGIPIIMTDPLGPQEEANREWVLETGVGIDHNISRYTKHWIIDKLYKGVFAKVARQAWDKGLRTALYQIPEIIDNAEYQNNITIP